MYEALLKATPEYQKVAASFGSAGPAALFGLPPTGRALLYAALQKDTGRILCVVTPGEAEATHFADDLKTLGLSAAVFPPRDFMLRPVEGAGREYEYRRLSVLGALAGGRLNAVCVPAEALLQYTVPQDEFQKNTLTLKPGMVYNREALVERLFAAGYVRRSQVDGPGQFSVRGDIVDIYAPDMRQPARVEYWDDEIDSLASFDLLTQRRDGALEKVYLSPAREVLFGSTADTAEALRAARSETGCTLEDVCAAAAYLLRWGGKFCLVHKPERLTDTACALREAGMEPKRLRFVQNRPDTAPSLFLIEGCRGGKPGVDIQPPLLLQTDTGAPTGELNVIYFRDQEV